MTPRSPERIVEITKRQRVPAQIRQLDALGIRYAMRADKTPWFVAMDSAACNLPVYQKLRLRAPYYWISKPGPVCRCFRWVEQAE